MMIKIEVPASDVRAQRIFGNALIELAKENEALVQDVIANMQPVEKEEPPFATIPHFATIPPVPTPQAVFQPVSDITPPPPEVADVPPVPTPPQPMSDLVPPPPVVEDHLDVNGLPWDERIHAGSRTKNQDGTWKARRIPADMGQEEWEAEQERVTQELRGVLAIETDSDDDEEQYTYHGLMIELGPHFKNPDFVTRAEQVIKQIGLNSITDLGVNQKLIGKFRKEVGLQND